MKKSGTTNFENLRLKAEKLLKKKHTETISQLSEADVLKLIHEFEVHQIELELQQEEILWAEQHAIEEAAKNVAAEFIEMYDLTQSGYFALSRDGVILALNQSGAIMLGKEWPQLKKSNFGFFVSEVTRPIFNLFLDKVFTGSGKESCEITLLKEGDAPRYVDLIGILSATGEHCLVSVADITAVRQSEDNLLLNNSRIDFAMRAVNMAWWEMDITTGNVTFGNRKAEMLGYPPEKFKHYTDFTALLHPDDYEKAMNAMRRHYTGDLDKYEVEYRILTNAGEYKWFYDIGSIVKRGLKGEPLRITGIVIDISDRKQSEAQTMKLLSEAVESRRALLSVIEDQKQAEMALRNNEANLRTLVQTIPDLIWVKNADGVYLSCNTMFCRFFGAKEADIVGKTDYDFVDKELADFFRANDRKAMAAEKPTINEEWITFADDGHRAFLETIKTPMYDSSGTLTGVLGIGRDITSRKHAENALAESYVRYKKLTQISPIGIFQTDGEGLTTFVNPAWCQISGLTFGDALGVNWLNAVHPDDREILFHGWLDAKKLNITSLSDYRFVRPDRSVAWVMGQAVPETNAEGKTIGYIGTITDITERKIAEEELIKAKEKAEEGDRLKSAFLANMSHEIRTPMNGILGFAELLKESNLTGEEQLDYIRMIEKSSARMLNIINDIVCISRIESGIMDISFSKTNINERIEYLYRFFKPEIIDKDIRLHYKNPLPDEHVTINTDKEKLTTILIHLVKNAIKFSNAGDIEFGYEKKGNYLEFYVRDSGTGIPKEQMEYIFEMFRQGSESLNRNYEGAGLGLSISKAFVKMLGGTIWVESEFGIGSTFYFTIPCQSEPVVNDGNIDSDPVEAGENQLNIEYRGLKILVADDDETSERLITMILKKLSNNILSVRNGLEVVEAFRSSPDFDLILMDIKMPVMDGLEAAREIRKSNKEVVIIAQSAYALAGDREKAIAAGCNDYIAKPFGRESLLALVKKHIHID